jgi:hypothetical protein
MVLFVTPIDIKRNTIINGNLDSNEFMQFIKIAQQIHIQNYLGTQLYDKYSDLIESGDINDPLFENYLTLLTDYIQPMLIHFAMVDYVPFAGVQIKNGGIFKHRSETADVPAKEEVDALTQKYRNFAEFYTRRFIDYMGIYASQNYPEYYLNANADMFPDTKANFVGWKL